MSFYVVAVKVGDANSVHKDKESPHVSQKRGHGWSQSSAACMANYRGYGGYDTEAPTAGMNAY